jgi:hypothetical protein
MPISIHDGLQQLHFRELNCSGRYLKIDELSPTPVLALPNVIKSAMHK